MNYFTHAAPFLADDSFDPYFIAGTSTPDWLSAADRSTRVRTPGAERVAGLEDAISAAVARGAAQHLFDDGWFHATPGFALVTADAAGYFRELPGLNDGFRCGFLGHVAMELLLDAELIARYPERLDRYHRAIQAVDARRVENAVNQMSARATERLAPFIEMFRSERVLNDYSDDARLLFRLNQVQRRVKLPALPDEAKAALARTRVRVRDGLDELLPRSRYGWPD